MNEFTSKNQKASNSGSNTTQGIPKNMKSFQNVDDSGFISIGDELKESYNNAVNHPLQSFEWGEFRKTTGTQVIRRARKDGKKLVDAYTLTIHNIPKLPYTIGYLPKSETPSSELMQDLEKIGHTHKCIFIQLEPNLPAKSKFSVSNIFKVNPAAHPLFTKYTFVLDLSKNDEDLLAGMHSKTRYNIRLAQRKGVTTQENNSDEAFKRYLELTEETTRRQKFYAHSTEYHKKQWKVLPHTTDQEHSYLSSHLLTATVEKEILTAWIVFVFKDTLYYPYGASSSKHRNTMHSNLIMWEAIQFGKKLGLKRFDMWGALGSDPEENDPWYGFHRFKQGYGPEHVEFIGSFDFILNQNLYNVYKLADKIRWAYLRLKK